MIETDEQRRWWFATHPEFSSSRKGTRDNKQRKEKEAPGKVRPEEVDAYVDEALKYERGPVAELLKSVKRNFGTEANSSREQQNLNAWAQVLEYDRVIPAVTYFDSREMVARLPTPEELSRWPTEMVRQFFRYIDTIIQNNPVLMDRKALEEHHMLVRQFAEYFMKCGLKLKDFIVIMTAADHRFKGEEGEPDGVHTGKGRGGDWNTEWKEFIDQWPEPDNSEEHQRRILDKLKDMKKRYRIDEKKILSPEVPRSR